VADGKIKEAPARCDTSGTAQASLVDLAARLDDLRVSPGNQLEALKADREGHFSIRINSQFRICFAWRDGDAFDVEIVDYH
jgi:toxin HigB-1